MCRRWVRYLWLDTDTVVSIRNTRASGSETKSMHISTELKVGKNGRRKKSVYTEFTMFTPRWISPNIHPTQTVMENALETGYYQRLSNTEK